MSASRLHRAGGSPAAGVVGAACKPALLVERVTVRADRLLVDVRVPDPACRRTTPALAARALAARPNLALHACSEAPDGATFSQVAGCTSFPHLFEHVLVDLLVERARDPRRAFAATTAWTDAACGRARIDAVYDDDLAALSACKQAVSLVNAWAGGGVQPAAPARATR